MSGLSHRLIAQAASASSALLRVLSISVGFQCRLAVIRSGLLCTSGGGGRAGWWAADQAEIGGKMGVRVLYYRALGSGRALNDGSKFMDSRLWGLDWRLMDVGARHLWTL